MGNQKSKETTRKGKEWKRVIQGRIILGLKVERVNLTHTMVHLRL